MPGDAYVDPGKQKRTKKKAQVDVEPPPPPPEDDDEEDENEGKAAHAMSLTVEPDVPLELSVSISTYSVIGPPRRWGMLENLCEAKADKRLHVRGMLSSRQAITMPPETHQAAGIPAGATSYAFAYPAQFALSTPEDVIRRDNDTEATAQAQAPETELAAAPVPEAEGAAARSPGVSLGGLPPLPGLEPKSPPLPPLVPLAEKAPLPPLNPVSVEEEEDSVATEPVRSAPAMEPSPSEPAGGLGEAGGSDVGGASGAARPKSAMRMRGFRKGGGARLESRPATEDDVDLSRLTFQELDSKLETLNLADEKWAYFLLVGGFVFFDEAGMLLQCNALTLVPSRWQLHFAGPFYPTRTALNGMRQAGRMAAVTLDVLQAAGFAAFGWAHGAEAPGGQRLDEGIETKIAHGAFVYEMAGSDPTYFALLPHTPEQIAKFVQDAASVKGHKDAEGGTERAPHGKMKLMRTNTMYNEMKRMKSDIKKQHTANKREEAEMRSLTKESDRAGQALAARWLSVWLRVLIVWFGAIPILAVLISLAYVSPFAFEMLACLVFSVGTVWLAWVPLRDTSALAIRYDFKHTVDGERERAALRYFRIGQVATPIILTGVYAFSQSGLSRSNATLIIEVAGHLFVYVALPLMLHYLRLQRGRAASKAADKILSVQHTTTIKPVHSRAPDSTWLSPSPAADGPAVSPPSSPPDDSTDANESNGPSSAAAARAAIKMQAKVRAKRARRQVATELRDRAKRLAYFSAPIWVTSLFDLWSNTIINTLIVRGVLDQIWYVYGLIFSLPAILMIIIDLRRDDRPRFSLSHGVFLITVLYRLGMRAASIDVVVWNNLTLAFQHFDVSAYNIDLAVPLLTMSAHLGIFILVTTFGKISLNIVASPNTCPHLIFPFQFFDFVFLYSFFSLRSMGTPITASWISQQVLLQVNIVFRNSGTTDAFMKKYLGGLFALLLCQRKQDKLKAFDPSQDSLMRLQYLARIGWQFDLADVAALIATPTLVTLIVWRDGAYTVEGTAILVRACELQNVWVRFGCLLIVKPAASWLARIWLRAKMRRTLLGKRTMHGTSQIAAKIIAERALRAGALRNKNNSSNIDDKVQDNFDFAEEEMAAVRDELSLSGLNFSVVRAKLMKKWRFYLCVVVVNLFSAFPCRLTAPAAITAMWSANGTSHVAVLLDPLPLSSVWYYVPLPMAQRLSNELDEAVERANLVSNATGSNGQAGGCISNGFDFNTMLTQGLTYGFFFSQEVVDAAVVWNTIDDSDLIAEYTPAQSECTSVPSSCTPCIPYAYCWSAYDASCDNAPSNCGSTCGLFAHCFAPSPPNSTSSRR